MTLKERLQPLEPAMPYLVLAVGLISAVLFIWYFAAETDRQKKRVGTGLTVLLTLFSLFCVGLGLKKGIDLQGGAAFLVQVQPSEGKEVTQTALQSAQEIIEKRLNPTGAKDVVVTPQGEDRLYVEVPGLSNEEIIRSKEVIQQVAKLEFRLLSPRGHSPVTEADIEPGFVKMPYRERSEEDRKRIEKGEKVDKVKDADLPLIFVKNRTEMSGKSVKSAYPQLEPGALNYSIGVRLYGDFGDQMMALTKANMGQPMAIVLDGVVISAPNINGQFGENFQITGSFTQKEAEELSSALMNPLENPLIVEQSSTTSAAYGEDVQRQGFISCLVGLGATLVFMMIYYRLSGIIAVLGLAVNLLMLLGAMQVFGFTLTMPGIAGIILTLGMAVDANVLIYERMREEFQAGKTLGPAIEAGYGKAFSAIFDSNTTTLITSGIMILVASGAVKGFGLSLTIGLICSLFAALLITRVCFLWLAGFGLQKLSFMHMITNRLWDFMGKRKLAFLISGTLVAASLAVIAIRGERSLGYELRGGDSVSLHAVKGLTVDQVNAVLKDFSFKDEKTGQTFDAASLNVQSVTPLGEDPYLTVRTAPGTADAIIAKLKTDLAKGDAEMAKAFDESDVQTMGPAVAGGMLKRSVLAILLGMVGIFVYLTFRFEFPFALGAIIALMHDVIISIAACSLAGKEVGLILIGAFLTIAGYSINDTIVIFDRVRENLRTMKGDLHDVLNHAISSTLSRTVITSGVTAIAVLAMFLFGGKSMADFSFAMLIGIGVGTYSSIFVASPVLLWWANRRKLNLRKQILDADAARLEALSGIEKEAPEKPEKPAKPSKKPAAEDA